MGVGEKDEEKDELLECVPNGQHGTVLPALGEGTVYFRQEADSAG